MSKVSACRGVLAFSMGSISASLSAESLGMGELSHGLRTGPNRHIFGTAFGMRPKTLRQSIDAFSMGALSAGYGGGLMAHWIRSPAFRMREVSSGDGVLASLGMGMGSVGGGQLPFGVRKISRGTGSKPFGMGIDSLSSRPMPFGVRIESVGERSVTFGVRIVSLGKGDPPFSMG